MSQHFNFDPRVAFGDLTQREVTHKQDLATFDVRSHPSLVKTPSLDAYICIQVFVHLYFDRKRGLFIEKNILNMNPFRKA